MPMIKCACGCNQEFELYDLHGRPRKFIRGHQTKGKERTPEWREKVSLANTGVSTWSKGLGKNQVYVPDTGRRLRRILNELKQKASWKCQKCSEIYFNNGRKIHTHHIDGNVLNNHKNNIEILCSLCHIGGHKAEQYERYKEVRYSSI